jgi:hypothetical protein
VEVEERNECLRNKENDGAEGEESEQAQMEGEKTRRKE